MISHQPIGSDFSLTEGDVFNQRDEQRNFVPRSFRTYWVSSGRDGLLALVKGFRYRRRNEFLLPSYICPEVIETLTPIVKVSFYQVKKDLTLDINAVEDCISPSTRALLLVHYFGFPHPQLHELARLCRDLGIMLIEDCVQAAFTKASGNPLGRVGNAAFCSLRKFLPIPDGGWLTTHTPIPVHLKDSVEHSNYVRLREILIRMRGLFPRDAVNVPDIFFKQAFMYADQEGTRYPKPAPMAQLSFDLLRRFPLTKWVHIRRKNYDQLVKLLPKSANPLFPRLPIGVVPLGLPVLVRHRDTVQRRLAAKRIYAPVHWRLSGVPRRFEDAWKLSKQLLTLPIDQRYSKQEMRKIAEEVRLCTSP